MRRRAAGQAELDSARLGQRHAEGAAAAEKARFASDLRGAYERQAGAEEALADARARAAAAEALVHAAARAARVEAGAEATLAEAVATGEAKRRELEEQLRRTKAALQTAEYTLRVQVTSLSEKLRPHPPGAFSNCVSSSSFPSSSSPS